MIQLLIRYKVGGRILGMSDQANKETMTGEIVPDGVRYVVAKNGAVRDVATGRIVSGSNITTKISTENSIALHSARKEKMQAAARAALARAANTRNSIEGLAYGIENIYSRAISGEEDLDKSRKVVLSVGKVAGLIDDTRQTLDNTGTNDSVSVGALSELKGILEMFLNAAQNAQK